MTDHPIDPDPFDLLRDHVRAVVLLERPGVDPDDLVAQITGTVDRADRSRGAQVLPLHASGALRSPRSPRRRRWLAAGLVAATVAVGSAGIAAFQGERPADPTADVVCRSSTDPLSSSIGLHADGDPVEQCARLWARGDLPDLDHPTPGGAVPRLVACTSRVNGALEVLPLPDLTTCADLGLLDADVEQADPALALQVRLQRHVAQCHDTAELEAYTVGLIEQLELSTWTVRVAAETTGCATAAIDSATRVITLQADPLAPSSSKENP
ncbi:MAG: hypothetical protein U0Q03_06395 [Acidimicrobiales bacterium]